MKQARIIQAADAVAYLPLYVAERAGYRLQLPSRRELSWTDALGVPERAPPAEFLKHIRDPSAREGDLGCLNAIHRAWKECQQPLIGFCDPLDIASPDYNSELTIVAGFIRKPCFWCLTDVTSTASHPKDLRIDALFGHIEGFSTGNAISRNINQLIPNRIDRKFYYGSFDLLVDGAVCLKQQDPTAKIAVISASILSCILAEDRGFRIAFPLKNIKGYDPFLTTAIVVHRECLNDQSFREAVVLLLLSIKKSLQLLREHEGFGIDQIKRLCEDPARFAHERTVDNARIVENRVEAHNPRNGKLATITNEQAKSIYGSLVSANIYSISGHVVSKDWSNAWTIRNEPIPALIKYFDESILRDARRYSLVGSKTSISLIVRIRRALFILFIAVPIAVTLTWLGQLTWTAALILIALMLIIVLFPFSNEQREESLHKSVWYGRAFTALLFLASVAVSFMLIALHAVWILGDYLSAPDNELTDIYLGFLSSYSDLIKKFGPKIKDFKDEINTIGGPLLLGLLALLARKSRIVKAAKEFLSRFFGR